MAYAAALDELRLGDHVCWSFADDRDRLDAEARFVAGGVRDAHKILIFAAAPDDVRIALTQRDVATEALLSTGQLEIWSDEQAYLTAGRFEPEAVLTALTSLIEAAIRQGYPGVRGIADMSWVHRVAGGAPRLRWYEAQLNRLLVEGTALAVCQYDSRLFSNGMRRGVGTAHPAAYRLGESGENWSPRLRARRVGEGPTLRLTGQVDESNWYAFETVLGGLVEEAGRTAMPAVLDVAQLTSMDGAAAWSLVSAARRVPAGLRLTGCRPELTRLLALVDGERAAQMVR